MRDTPKAIGEEGRWGGRKKKPPVVEVDNGLMVTLYCDKTKQMRTMGKE